MIKPSTEVSFTRHDGLEVWRGQLKDFLAEHHAKQPRVIISVVEQLSTTGKTEYDGLFTLKLVGG